MLRATWCLVFVAIVSVANAVGQDNGALRKPLVGKIPPELVSSPSDWLAGSPTSLEKLRGRVVWLQFNF